MKEKIKLLFMVAVINISIFAFPYCVQGADIKHSGVDGDLSWSIDANGKLLIEGKGDYKSKNSYTTTGWLVYSDEILAADINVEEITDTSYMFNGCKNLKDIDMSDFDTSKVTNMCGMFYLCEELEQINFKNFSTENVVCMKQMFLGCEALKSFDSAEMNTANVTDMSEMFLGGVSLRDVDVSGFNTTNVSDMSYMFHACYGLRELDLSGFKTKELRYINGMFNGCGNLQKLDISNFNLAQVYNADYLFVDCDKLAQIKSSQNKSDVDLLLPVKKGYYWIYSTSPKEVKKINKKGIYQRVKKGKSLPKGTVLKGSQVTFDGVLTKESKFKVTSKKSSTPTVELAKALGKAETVIVPNAIKYNGVEYKVTGIGENAFSGNKKIKKITVSKNITQIGKGAFKNCKNLKQITIKTIKLKVVGDNALSGINSKCKIYVPAKKFKSYKKMLNGKGQKKTVKIKKK